MKFLVIGGAGYVGSHFVAEASRRGHESVVLDNLSTGHQESVKDCHRFIKNDVRRQVAFADILEEVAPDAILHYAANALVAESVADPKKYYDNNVTGVKSILEVLARAKSKPAFIFSSTCAVYGIPPESEQTMPETLNKNPISPYGRTKLVCEFMIEDFAKAYGIKAASLRYFNAAGADREKDIGESHDPETHLIPLAIKAALTGDKLEIFGNDYPTPDGTCIRDYIHVTDLATAHLNAASHLVAGPAGQYLALNLGTGNGHSNLEVVEQVKRASGRPLPYTFAPRRAGDPPRLVADPRAAQKILGWNPVHSSLETIVASALKWQMAKKY